jgi:hypothetical protein
MADAGKILGGVASNAANGLAFGPIGGAVGAAVGLIGGLFGGGGPSQKEQFELQLQKTVATMAMNIPPPKVEFDKG